jgi:hypothetical protein
VTVHQSKLVNGGLIPVTDQATLPSYDELRSRIAIARSVLGHAPLYRAVTKALAALDGAALADLAAREDEAHNAPPGSAESLRYWQDGYEAGYAHGIERRDGSEA